ncbi:META domain-containing protein [Sphingomonas mollis]|uniref:META domain-containing protein n=1 Tax=Sphingomonas mollis TaxID=2795726 RepID=A0ABS0XMK6_9SPHN|nr:META domain-containing protein [Sphingomonas sp. BT553]MBJ6121050.1 META domain-containing protein [Sphingomonas sp. BT553]
MIAIALLAAAAGSVDYRASGTEPFWSLTIDDRHIRLEQVSGRPISVAVPKARSTANGRRYVTPAMTVAIVRKPCSDGMSDRHYPDTVTVNLGRRRLQGCGGLADRTAMKLADTHWAIAALDGKAVRMPGRATVDFDADVMRARICNRIAGSYRLEGNTLRLGDLRATRMACIEDEVMRVESRFLALGGSPVTMTRPDTDTLVLRDARGSVTLTRRSSPAS